MGNMFPHTPLEAQALIVRLEREKAKLLAALKPFAHEFDMSNKSGATRTYGHHDLERAFETFVELGGKFDE